MVYIFSGREFAQQKEQELKLRVRELKSQGVNPKILAVLVGNDPASVLYTSLKKQAAERVGIELQLVKLSPDSRRDVVYQIKVANKDESIQGVMVQMPLPKELGSERSREKVIFSIVANKDVDGLTPKKRFKPATLKAIMYAISQAQDKGYLPKLDKIAVCVVGATGTVGKSVVRELKKIGIRPKQCDIKTKNLKYYTKKADLLISAAGVPGLITADMVKQGVVVVDVGAPKGDVDQSVREVAAFLTPVPGGIGPMTVACLLENVVSAAERSVKRVI